MLIRKGDRVLAIEARCYNGEWGCIAIEGPAKFSAKTAAEAIGEVFDDHSHRVIVATPRKKGARVTFDDVKRAAKKFARDWRPGKATPCDCGPITNGGDE